MPRRTLEDASDFRRAAVAASLAALASRGVVGRATTTRVLSSFDCSLCVPAGGDPVRFRRVYGGSVFALAVLGLGCWAAAALLTVAAAPLFKGPGRTVAAGAAPVAFVGGAIAMTQAKRLQSFIFRRYRRSERAVSSPGDAPPVVVTIEEPGTERTVKVVTEDVAELTLHAGRRLVAVEGFSHRYLIRGADVIRASVSRTRISDFVVVEFRVGDTDVPLGLAINYSTAQTMRQRQAGELGEPPLVGWLTRTLGVSVEDAGVSG